MNSKDGMSREQKRSSQHKLPTRFRKNSGISRKALRRKAMWTFEERCRLAEAVESDKGTRFPHFITKYVGTSKESEDIKNYRKYYRLVEQGTPFPEFRNKAPLDAWINLAEKTVRKEDKSAEQCIPQLLTVAALENNCNFNEISLQQPNYANVYTFLSVILRGEDPPDLPPADARVVLKLLDGTVDRLASSISMLQKEFLHQAFGMLHKADTNVILQKSGPDDDSNCAERMNKSFPSLNPLNVPLNLLEFRKKQQISLDLALNWKTGHSNM